MNLGICTIQRDRARWITEWCAFHYLVGFRKFHFFAHACRDNTYSVLRQLQERIDMTVFIVPERAPQPQLAAFQFAYDKFGDAIDWMAFIDGDEFLFPTSASDIGVPIAELDDGNLSALAVYWSCFGSSGHLAEPEGLIVENFRRRAPDDFAPNRLVKSIVRGRLGKGFHVAQNAHGFVTPGGTFDEKHRQIEHAWPDYAPSYERLRINHYVTQSRQFFTDFKANRDVADTSPDFIRREDWWTQHDRNDVYDSSVERFTGDLRALVRDWSLGTRPETPAAAFPLMRRLADPEPGRNQPCPCGSGIRFKACHGGLDQPQEHSR